MVRNTNYVNWGMQKLLKVIFELQYYWSLFYSLILIFLATYIVFDQEEEVTKGMAYLFAEMGESYVDLISSGM